MPAEDVDRFIEAARELKIKGLTEEYEVANIDPNGLPNDEDKHKQFKEEVMQISKPYGFEKILLNESSESDYLNNIEAKQEKNLEKLSTEIGNRMEKVKDTKEGLMWKCTECGKMLKNKTKLKMHVETHLEGFSHRCVHCDKTHKTTGALYFHISVSHRGVK